MSRWMCQSCDWNGEEIELLEAQNPFNHEQTIHGCPKCKAIDDIVGACDEPGCKKPSSCGWNSKQGYRRTCGLHMKWPHEEQ